MLRSLGLSISYQRVLQLEKQIASSVIEAYEKEGVVVPSNIMKNTFTVSAINNIDFDGSSNTSNNAFRGTSICIHQQPDDSATEREKFHLSSQGYKIELLESYALVEIMNTVNEKPSAPAKQITAPFFKLDEELEREERWAQQSSKMIPRELQEGDMMSWAGYFAALDIQAQISNLL